MPDEISIKCKKCEEVVSLDDTIVNGVSRYCPKCTELMATYDPIEQTYSIFGGEVQILLVDKK